MLANRLTEDGKHSVLLLEYGGSDRSIFVQMPSALSIPMGMEKYDWRYYTEPEPGLGGRRLHTPRGKVLGGSSSINGLVYVRGNPRDFDRWESEGAAGWSYADVLPYFRRAETRAAGGNEYRGDSGPLQTRYGSLSNPLHAAWLEAGRQAGYAATDDINGLRQEGFGKLDMTVGPDGRRSSAANAYLRPAMGRPKLEVRTQALATRVLFDGKRATGVEYRQGATLMTVAARREVIVSTGSINSPKLLKLSGVGPAAELREFGIPVVHDLPGVGENLQDHLEFYFQVACTQPITLYSSMGLFARALIGARWLLFKDGLGATNHFETGGFIRSRPDVPYPDIQFHFLPLAVTYDGSSLAQEHGFQAHVGPMRSKSRGRVRPRFARSARQAEDPVQLPEPPGRPRRVPRRHAIDARDLRAEGLRSLPRARDPARQGRADGRRDRRLRAREGRERLSPVVQQQDGCAQRRDGGRGPGSARDRPRGAARHRLLDHAVDHDRQPQRADDHAGGKAVGPRSR